MHCDHEAVEAEIIFIVKSPPVIVQDTYLIQLMKKSTCFPSPREELFLYSSRKVALHAIT